MNDNQCVPRRAEQINYDPNCDLTAKSFHVGHHTIVDSKAKNLSNIMDHKSPLQADNIIINSNAKNLPNIIDLKSQLQAPRNSVIINVVDTYPIIDRNDFSPN